jgi:AcrR family transcriptional regulator
VVRRGRPPAAESLGEDEILAAALRSFAAHGYQGTSVRDLNAELGVSHSLIHRRFGSKLDLWKATADRWFGEFVAQLDPVLDSIRPGEPLAAFRRFIVAFIEASAARPDLLRMMQLEGALESERLEYVWERHVRPLGQRMNRVVRSLEGSERYTALPATTTFFLLAHGATAAPSHAAAARRIDPTDPTDPTVLRRHADAVADLFLGVDPG